MHILPLKRIVPIFGVYFWILYSKNTAPKGNFFPLDQFRLANKFRILFSFQMGGKNGSSFSVIPNVHSVILLCLWKPSEVKVLPHGVMPSAHVI